jgi:hypothetical protein
MVDPTLPLAGLSPIEGKEIIARFDAVHGASGCAWSTPMTTTQPRVINRQRLRHFCMARQIRRTVFTAFGVLSLRLSLSARVGAGDDRSNANA